MDNKEIIEKYARELITWIDSISSNEDVPNYYENFCKRTSNFSDSGMQICFDERVVKSIIRLFDTLQYQSFDSQLYPSKKRKLLGLIANELYLQKFISRKHLSDIRQKQNQTMLNHKIRHYFQKIGEQDKASYLRDIWKKQIGFQIAFFWQWIIKQKISHQTLIYLYEYTLKMGQDLPSEVQQSPHFQWVQRQYQNYMWKNDSINKSHLDTQSHSKHFFLQSGINQSLFDIAVQNSLYLKKTKKPIIKAIRAFIKDLSDILFPQREAHFEPFGSVRNKMALVENFDIDLTVIFSKQRKLNYNQSIKINDFQYLQLLRGKIQYQQFDWLMDCYMGKLTGPFAYMKLTVNTDIIRKNFKIPHLSKIDITVDNNNAIINSEFISKFAQKQEILAFCILVKLWAKNSNVVNAKHPMEGFSCYGLILMCLFYLMKTGQIDYIEQSKPVKIERCEMKQLHENFYYFLKFYSKHGQFRNKKMTVCLMKRIQNRFIYDQKLIINMYDHLDNSNPGRLTIDYAQKFDFEISKAIEAFQSNEFQRILELFNRS